MTKRLPAKKPYPVAQVEVPAKIESLRDGDRVHAIVARYFPQGTVEFLPEADGYMEQELDAAIRRVSRSLHQIIASAADALVKLEEGSLRDDPIFHVHTNAIDVEQSFARFRGLVDAWVHAQFRAALKVEAQEGAAAIEHDRIQKGLGVTPDYVWCNYVGAIVEPGIDHEGTCKPEDHQQVFLPKEVLE